MKYFRDQIEALNAELAREPAEDESRQKVTKQQAVRIMAPGIWAMRQKGHTFERVAEKLAQRGVPISTGTLRSYLRRSRRRRKRTPAVGPAAAKPMRPQTAPANTEERREPNLRRPTEQGPPVRTEAAVAPPQAQSAASRGQHPGPKAEPAGAKAAETSKGTFTPRKDRDEI